MDLQYLRNGKSHVGKPIKKFGTLDIHVVETTPVVWKDKLYLMQWSRNSCPRNPEKRNFHCLRDMENGTFIAKHAYDHIFGSAYTENDVMYTFAIDNRNTELQNKISVFRSSDLENWEEKTAIEMPEEWTLFNTSVCRGGDGRYVMAIEAGSPEEIIGERFTMIFARSDDLLNWEIMPYDRCIYTKNRYSACPCLRWSDGYYYMIYLEGLPAYRWAPYIVRTADFENFDLAVKNPFIFYGDEDKNIIDRSMFSNEEIEYIESAVISNISDIDMCEYKGKTVISYSWGNQLGHEFLGLAEYDGSMDELLQSYFR